LNVFKMTRTSELPELATAKAEETRARILNAALRLFRERGFDSATMRDVAAEAGVANGAAYYYFRSKEELVMAFYIRGAVEMRGILPAELAKTRDLKKRLKRIIELKFDQFADHRAFLVALFRTAVDPLSPLSPFGEGTRAVREETIDWFRQALAGTTEKIPPEFLPYLPRLFWLYQMGLILFWIYDRSKGQARTRSLVDGTLDLIVRGLRLSRLPLMGSLRASVARLLRTVDSSGVNHV